LLLIIALADSAVSGASAGGGVLDTRAS
jgi:hypothetical protein